MRVAKEGPLSHVHTCLEQPGIPQLVEIPPIQTPTSSGLTASHLERCEACRLFAQVLFEDLCSFTLAGATCHLITHSCPPYHFLLPPGRQDGLQSGQTRFHQKAKTAILNSTASCSKSIPLLCRFLSHPPNFTSLPFFMPMSTLPLGANATMRPPVSCHIEPCGLICVQFGFLTL